jgi:hypothetical protein
MTAVNEHRLGEELVADGPAGAAASKFLCHGELISERPKRRKSAVTAAQQSSAVSLIPFAPLFVCRYIAQNSLL